MYSIFLPVKEKCGSSTWGLVTGQQNHLRNALKVSDILLLVALKLDRNKSYRPMFSLPEYASYVYGFFLLPLHQRTKEPSPTSCPLSLTRHDFLMMANLPSKFQSEIWQRKRFCPRWIMTASIAIFGMLFLEYIISYHSKSRRYISLFPK